MRHLRWLGPLAALLVLTGCSLAQFAYNRLDVLARWELSDYVDLDPSQRAVFDREFRTLWAWHRQTELPLYVAALRTLAERQDPTDRAALEAVSAQYRERSQTLLRAAAPIACTVGVLLSDAQVQTLLKAVDEDLAEYAETYVEPPEERQRKDTEREVRTQLDRWFGDLSAAQRTLIRTWSAERQLSAEAWLTYRRSWRQSLAGVMAARKQPEYCERVTTLIADGGTLWTPEQQTAFARNRTQWLDLFEQLGPTLTPAQRAHVKERMLALAEDFERLATEAPASNPAPSQTP